MEGWEKQEGLGQGSGHPPLWFVGFGSSQTSEPTLCLFLGQEIQRPCCVPGGSLHRSQELGITGCWGVGQLPDMAQPSIEPSSGARPSRAERAPGIPLLACSIACRVRVGDALLATPLSPSPLPQAQKLLGAAEPAWHVEWLVQSVPTGGQSPPRFFCDTDTKAGECQRGSKGSEARPNGHFSSWPLGGARAHWSKACLLVPH